MEINTTEIGYSTIKKVREPTFDLKAIKTLKLWRITNAQVEMCLHDMIGIDMKVEMHENGMYHYLNGAKHTGKWQSKKYVY